MFLLFPLRRRGWHSKCRVPTLLPRPFRGPSSDAPALRYSSSMSRGAIRVASASAAVGGIAADLGISCALSVSGAESAQRTDLEEEARLASPSAPFRQDFT